MSLASLVTKATSAAFAAAGDLVVSITWRQTSGGTYDVTAGTMTGTDVDTVVSAIVKRLRKSEAERPDVSQRSIRFVIRGSGFDAITPARGDYVVHAGSIYKVEELSWSATTDVWEALAEYVAAESTVTVPDFSSDFNETDFKT